MAAATMQKLFKKHARKAIACSMVLLFSIGLWQLAAAAWIQGKAFIAQQLLDHAWQETMSDKKAVTQKPWPWADTWPLAKLIVPQHHIEQIILAGDSGSSLAFAPGVSLSGSLPNSQGTTVISAHRDTHFSFLKDIKINETFFLQTLDKTTRYRVYDLQIVDSKIYALQADPENQTLVLVTCYPFNAITTGGSSRYLVFARPTNPA
jgi:sortase A